MVDDGSVSGRSVATVDDGNVNGRRFGASTPHGSGT